MPATLSPARYMRHVRPVSPFDGLTVVRFLVVEGSRVDPYAAIHWADSCDVRVCHSDDEARSYTVTCSAATGTPVWCDCPANHRRVVCKHKGAVAKLTALGHLTLPVLTDAGHDRGQTECPFPDEATAAAPGTPEKVAVMAGRAKAGRKLWHPDDRPATE